jgi:ectoine hydroxylase-related dioxygenase (phytanoyl-CoA dioxygenase family)
MSEQLVYSVGEEDLGNQQAGPALVEQTRACMQKNGAVGINNVFDTALLERVHQAYIDRYEVVGAEANNKQVGDKRSMLAVEIKPPFSDVELLLNPFLMPIVTRLLGADCILDAYTAVSSLPGAADQHVHVDYPYLFEDEALSQSLPTYTITVAVPLLPLTPLTGTTRIWPGSHRNPSGWKEPPPIKDSVSLFPEFGGCYLFDARLQHGGTANLSDRSRPILYLVYTRPWWRDYTNFFNQKPLNIDAAELATLSDPIKTLFRFA